jgi:ATP-binding cassette, subfamily F, member 3
VRIFPGNYEDYLWRKQGGPEEIAKSARSAGSSNGNRSAPKAPEAGEDPSTALRAGAAPPPQKKKINPYKLKEMEGRRKKLEAEIARAEADIADAEQKLLVFQSAEETIRLTQLLEQRRKDVSERMGEWEAVSQELEEVQ